MGPPVARAGHVRRVPGGARSSVTRAEIRYLFNNQNQHNNLYCTHENGEQFGYDVPLHMPAVASDNRPRTVHCCYVYLP